MNNIETQVCNEEKLEWQAPALKKGDVAVDTLASTGPSGDGGMSS